MGTSKYLYKRVGTRWTEEEEPYHLVYESLWEINIEIEYIYFSPKSLEKLIKVTLKKK